VTVSDAELEAMPTGTYVTPREGTYFSVKGMGMLYRFTNGKVHEVSPAVAKKRRIKAHHYSFDAEIVKDWPVGKPISNP